MALSTLRTGLLGCFLLSATAVAAVMGASPTLAQSAGFKDAVTAAVRGDVGEATSLKQGLSGVDAKIIDWLLVRGGGLSAEAITAFAARNRTWPDAEMFRRRAEQALERENPPADAVIAAFGSSQPISSRGAMLLARAHMAKGNRDAAARVIRKVWREEAMAGDTESDIIREFGSLLRAEDHRVRVNRALLKDKADDAKLVARQLGSGWLQLAEARLAVEKKKANAGKLLAAVPGDLSNTAAYIFARAQYARRQENWTDAANWLEKAPRDPAGMVVPDEWWEEKRIVSRKLLELGDARRAYRLIADHQGSSRPKQSEAEFHKGWYALRFLRDPQRARGHFAKVGDGSQSPITLARMHYWLGRADEAAGGDGRSSFEKAAGFGNAFYGMLARTKLGRSDFALTRPPGPSGADESAFANDDRVAAIRRLAAIGREDLAGVMYRHMAKTLPTAGQMALLIRLAESQGWHHWAVRVGKEGIQRDMDMELLAYPLRGLPANPDLSGMEPALAFALARQESEFNQSVVSTAGAVGIIQVMPATGVDAAKTLGIPFDRARWRNDPHYNLRLGTAYVQKLINNYDGHYVMAIAGYNAGPGRIREWVQRFGDPRDPKVDIVDWMELIPFGETRNYVHRVLENLQIYRFKKENRGLELAKDLRRGVGARGGTTAVTGSVTRPKAE